MLFFFVTESNISDTSLTETAYILQLRKFEQFKKHVRHRTSVNSDRFLVSSIITIAFYQTSQPHWYHCTASSRKMLSGHGNRSRTKYSRQLRKPCMTVHYHESKPLILACDASQYGLGAVLSHTMSDGTETSHLHFQNADSR